MDAMYSNKIPDFGVAVDKRVKTSKDRMRYIPDLISSRPSTSPEITQPRYPVENRIKPMPSVVSLFPVVDTFADAAAISVDAMRGDWGSVALDVIGMLPLVGEIADAKKTAKVAEKAVDAIKATDSVADTAKTIDKAEAVLGITRQTDDFDGFPKTIHEGNQGKHIIGHNNYMPGRSITTISNNELLELVKRYSGMGRKHNPYKETVDFGVPIGRYIEKDTGKVFETTVGTIHYSRMGIHVVPAKPKNWRR